MKKFDRDKFREYVAAHVGFPIIKAEGKTENPDYDKAEERVQEEVDSLSAMEVACYLGEFLTEKKK